MKKLTILRFAALFLTMTAILSSCSKENTEVIEEVIETKYEMEVTVRGVSNTYDAFAAYCDENGIVSFSVSNNAALLGNDLWTSEINEGDFVVHYRMDAEGSFSLGGTILETEIDGQTIKNFTLTDASQVDIDIETANETEVLGSLDGDFLVITDPISGGFEMVPFSVTFAGEVDGDLTPIFCQ